MIATVIPFEMSAVAFAEKFAFWKGFDLRI